MQSRRTCKSKQVPGAAHSTTAVVQLASAHGTVPMLAESWKMTATYPVLYGPGQHQLPTFTLQDRRCSGNTQDRAHVGRQPDTSGDIAAATKYLGGNAARPCSTSGYRADDLLEKPVADVCPDCYTHGDKTTMRKELSQTGGQPSIIHEPCHGRVQRHAGDVISTTLELCLLGSQCVPAAQKATVQRRRTR